MNKLPRVLQNEIYEFARGDRKYWKQQMSIAISNTNNDGMAYCAISKPFKGRTIRLLTDFEHWFVMPFHQDYEIDLPAINHRQYMMSQRGVDQVTAQQYFHRNVGRLLAGKMKKNQFLLSK